MNTQAQVKVVKRAERQDVVSDVATEKCNCDILQAELLRRFMELRRAVKSFEAFANKQGLDLKSE